MYTQLMHRLMTTSPIIAEHIEGYRVTLAHSDGVLTQNELLNDCFVILINLLAEQGIKIHVDHDELLSDFYSAELLIDLYQRFIPDKLFNYLDNNDKLYNIIKTSIHDIPQDELLVSILELNDQLYGTELNSRLYVFFHDKVVNNAMYHNAISEYIANHNDDAIDLVFDKDMLSWLAMLSAEKLWAKRVLSALIANDNLSIRGDNLITYIERSFRVEYTNPEYTMILAYPNIRKANFAIFKSKLDEIHRSYPFYEDYYSYRNFDADYPKNISDNQLVIMILNIASDMRLFDNNYNYSSILDTKLKLIEHNKLKVREIINAMENLPNGGKSK